MRRQGKPLSIMNAIMSMTVCLAMVFTYTFGADLQAYGASGDSLTATKGVYYFEPHEIADVDLTDNYVYDDALLTGSSLEYNQKLATMSYELAVASMSSQRVDYPDKSQNLKAYLEDNGFIDFDTNQYYKEKMTTASMGAACAHKKITDNGREYTLLVIVPRSAGYEAEWGGNFVLDTSGDHGGFKNGRQIVLDYAKEYIKKYGIIGDIKVWTAGYSRGAGVTNQVGAALVSQPNTVLGSSITLTPENVYCYTFGTPKSADSENGDFGNYADDKFKYVHNTFETYDIVTVAPPAGFGFNRYGSDSSFSHYTYADRGDKKHMLRFLEQTNSVVYKLYTNGGDPDGFKPKTVKASASLIDGSKLEIVDADGQSTYLPDNQRDFMAMMDESIVKAVEMDAAASGSAREKYANGGYQDSMRDFCGYFFANLDKGGKIVEGMEDSKYIKPLAASLYVSYMLEMYKNEIAANSEGQLAELKKALDALDQIAAEAGGWDNVSAEIRTQYDLIAEEMARAEEEGYKAEQKWTNIAAYSRNLTTALFRQVFKEGLDNAGIGSGELVRNIVADTDQGKKEARAFSRILSYMMLYDTHQTNDKVISFGSITDQVSHMATFMGNASSFMRPHNNEVILSWLRTLDSNYDDFEKENDAQKAGYRRLYISRSGEDSVVTAKVIDEGGNVVAVVKNGMLTQRTDSWIGVTTSDNGNWLRLPLDKTYRVEIRTDKDTKLSLKASEYSVYDNESKRDITKDTRETSIDWTELELKAADMITCVLSEVTAADSEYVLPSDADYYVEVQKDAAPDDPIDKDGSKAVLAVKGIASGKKSVKFTWNTVSGAERYVIYMAKCNTGKKKYSLKKVKTLKSTSRTWTKKGLKKNTKYRFYAVAQKKVDGSYVNIAKSVNGYIVTGNKDKTYTNPKSLKLNKTLLSLDQGRTAAIKGTVKKAVKGRKLMTSRAAKLRFTSTNPEVAKVSSKGKVTAVSAGSCRIYVQTINGIWKIVKVTVK